jgi:hypothetical protein
MDFNEKGFLGTAIDEFSKSVQIQYARFFQLSHQINELAHATKFELQVHNLDPQEYLAATLFLRLLNGFEATVILGTKGLLFEAKVVLRSVIETLFILKLLCKEEAFALEYLGSGSTPFPRTGELRVSPPVAASRVAGVAGDCGSARCNQRYPLWPLLSSGSVGDSRVLV